MADEKPEEVEVQEPQKKEKKSLGVSLPLVIVAAVGILVIIVLGVILGVVLSNKFIGNEGAADGKGNTAGTAQTSQAAGDGMTVENGYLSKLEDVLLMETGRITTNPKGSPSVFVVVNFSIEFKKMDPDNSNLKTLAKGSTVDMEHPFMKKLMAKLRGVLNNMLASYTQQELLDKRQELPDMVKEALKPIFREYELALGDVAMQEFIIQD